MNADDSVLAMDNIDERAKERIDELERNIKELTAKADLLRRELWRINMDRTYTDPWLSSEPPAWA